jgi:hypothetical protein
VAGLSVAAAGFACKPVGQTSSSAVKDFNADQSGNLQGVAASDIGQTCNDGDGVTHQAQRSTNLEFFNQIVPPQDLTITFNGATIAIIKAGVSTGCLTSKNQILTVAGVTDPSDSTTPLPFGATTTKLTGTMTIKKGANAQNPQIFTASDISGINWKAMFKADPSGQAVQMVQDAGDSGGGGGGGGNNGSNGSNGPISNAGTIQPDGSTVDSSLGNVAPSQDGTFLTVPDSPRGQ